METVRSSSGEIVEMLESRSVDICYVQETRLAGKWTWMISWKAAVYKLFWIRNKKGSERVGIFLTKDWVDKVIDISWVSDRMIVIKLLVQGIIISIVSVYAPKYGLDDSQKDNFYDGPINFVRKLGKKEVVVIAGDLNDHVASKAEDFEDQREGYGWICSWRKAKGFWSFVMISFSM